MQRLFARVHGYEVLSPSIRNKRGKCAIKDWFLVAMTFQSSVVPWSDGSLNAEISRRRIGLGNLSAYVC